MKTVLELIQELQNHKYAKLTDNKVASVDNRLTPYSLIKQVHDLYWSNGLSIREAAKMHGIHKDNITKAFKQYGFAFRNHQDAVKLHRVKNPNHGIDAHIIENWDEKKKDILSGMKRIDFASKWNISITTVNRYLKRMHDEGLIKFKSDFQEQKIQDILSGMSRDEYCQKYGVNRARYYQIKRKLKKDLASSK